MRSIRREELNRFLIIRMDHVGDVLLTTPVLKALRFAFPKSYLAVLVRSSSRPMMINNPYVDHLFVYTPEWWSRPGERPFTRKETERVFGLLRRARFDLAFDFRGEARTVILTVWAGAKYRVGFDYEGTGGLDIALSHGHYVVRQGRHQVEINLDVVRAIGVDLNVRDRAPELFLSSKERSFAQSFLRGLGREPRGPVVGLHPGAGHPSKVWTVEGYAEVGNWLTRTKNATVIITGEAFEARLVRAIAERISPPPVVAVGRTNLRQLAALIEGYDLLVAPDCGPAHIAAALKTPLVAIFGGVNEIERWRPYGEGHIIIHHDLECAPCFNYNCRRGYRCLREITPAEVMAAAEAQLGRRGF